MVHATEYPLDYGLKPAMRRVRIVTSAAAAVAIAVWWAWFGPNWKIFLTLGPAGPIALLLFAAVTALLAVIPLVHRTCNWLGNVLAKPTPTTRRAIAAAMTIISTIYLAWTAKGQG